MGEISYNTCRRFDHDDTITITRGSAYFDTIVNLLDGWGNTIVLPKIKKVIFNDPATIIFWEDNTKSVVKCENEDYDPEKGMVMAIAKKALGNKGNYFNVIKKWTEQQGEEND